MAARPEIPLLLVTMVFCYEAEEPRRFDGPFVHQEMLNYQISSTLNEKVEVQVFHQTHSLSAKVKLWPKMFDGLS